MTLLTKKDKPPTIQYILWIEPSFDLSHQFQWRIGGTPSALMGHLGPRGVSQDHDVAMVGNGRGLQIADQGTGQALGREFRQLDDQRAVASVGLNRALWIETAGGVDESRRAAGNYAGLEHQRRLAGGG